MALENLVKPDQLSGPILVTGHTGFKGMWLTLLLRHLGYPVVGFSLAPTTDSLYERLDYKGKVEEVYEDINNKDVMEDFLFHHKPSVVFHLAAQALVLDSYADPLRTFQTNVLGTANVLAASCKVDSILKVAVTTTDKVYLNENTGKRFKETDPLGGIDPYSCSKVATESVILAYQCVSKMNRGPKISSLRAGNVIGGGDLSKDRILPDIVRALSSGNAPEIRNPFSTRPWQHVLDPLIGYLLASLSVSEISRSENFNFGPDGDSLSVNELCDLSIRTWNQYENQNSYQNKPSIYHEATSLALDSEKAKLELGWAPHFTQEEAIVSTIEWWKLVLDGANPLTVCNNAIAGYLGKNIAN